MPQANLSIIPVRAEPSDKSEIVTQLLFGEEYTVLEETEKWVKIEISFDFYQGWIDKKQNNNQLITTNKSTVISSTASITVEDQPHIVSIGSQLDFSIECTGQTSAQQQDILNIAKIYLNTPYLWGGKSIFGIDCSGFTQQVFKTSGINLPRDAYQQADLGDEIVFENRQAKDLAFFTSNNKITHVGILISPFQIIHASGKVRIDTFTDQGIIHSETSELTHHLTLIKRYN